MRTIDSTFTTNKNAASNQPIYLYTIYDYDSAGHNLYYAEYDQVVSYNGVSYVPFPILHDMVGESSKGEVDRVQITIANVSRAIAGYLSVYDWRKKKVVIKTVWANSLADADAFVDDTFFIDSYSIDEEKAVFTLASKLDVLEIVLPKRTYLRNYCAWKFKSTECGYVGAETTCNKTLTRCRVLANQLRFGGFPSIPSQRTFIS